MRSQNIVVSSHDYTADHLTTPSPHHLLEVASEVVFPRALTHLLRNPLTPLTPLSLISTMNTNTHNFVRSMPSITWHSVLWPLPKSPYNGAFNKVPTHSSPTTARSGPIPLHNSTDNTVISLMPYLPSGFLRTITSKRHVSCLTQNSFHRSPFRSSPTLQ
jgi:hypothetical protein